MIVIKDNKGFYAKEVKIFGEKELKILKKLSEKEYSLSELSKELNIYPQLLSYYINKKLKDFIEVKKVENKVVYKAYKAYVVLINEKEDFTMETYAKKDLEPFVKDKTLNSLIVVGAPFPHGPFSASARDIHYVGFLMSYLGKFFDKSKYTEYIKLDTDVIKENLLKENLIVLGGPVTNMVTYKLNTVMKIRFLQEYNWDLYSEFTDRRYSDEYTGLVANIKNPWDQDKRIIVLAGKRAIGTKLAIKYFIQEKLDLSKDFYIIIQGIDLDGDGFPEKIKEIEKIIF